MRSSAALTLLAGLSAVSALPSLRQVRQAKNDTVDTYSCEGKLLERVSDAQYACSDIRLGPAVLPALDSKPLGPAVANYKRYGNYTIDEFLGIYWNETYNEKNEPTGWIYPPKEGFLLDNEGLRIASTVVVKKDTYVDRFGGTGGAFVAPAGAGFAMRALPPDALFNKYTIGTDNPNGYHLYKVLKEFSVSAGPIAPWFGQPGGGTQFWLGENWSVQMLLNATILEEVLPAPGILP